MKMRFMSYLNTKNREKYARLATRETEYHIISIIETNATPTIIYTHTHTHTHTHNQIKTKSEQQKNEKV